MTPVALFLFIVVSIALLGTLVTLAIILSAFLLMNKAERKKAQQAKPN